MAMVLANDENDYSIKPEATTPALDTSSWPLLLKGYDKCMSTPAREDLEIFAESKQYSFGLATSRQFLVDAPL